MRWTTFLQVGASSSLPRLEASPPPLECGAALPWERPGYYLSTRPFPVATSSVMAMRGVPALRSLTFLTRFEPHWMIGSGGTGKAKNFKVIVRVRPLNKDEKARGVGAPRRIQAVSLELLTSLVIRRAENMATMLASLIPSLPIARKTKSFKLTRAPLSQ